MDLSINTKDYALKYEKYPLILKRYSNTNWIADFEESKSTSGYMFTLRGIAISWKSSKQTCIAHSIMKSKFISLDKTREEVKWLRQFWRWSKRMPPICIHCDNQAVIFRAQNFVYNDKSRHIYRKYDIVR